MSGTVGEFFGGSGRRIRDVIWGDIPAERSVRALLETGAMQRLSGLSQLGGLRINEPAADLSVATAIASSVRNVPVPPGLAVVGEVGLSGELRSVSHLDRRLNEAAQLGFKRCIVPHSSQTKKHSPEGLEVITTRILAEALDIALR